MLIHNEGAFIDTGSYNVSISTALQNASGKTGGLIKQGTGRLTLTGTSSYTGITTVEQGSLWVSGRLVSGVKIKSGATLGGTGTVGAVVIERGSIIAPGNSPGTLHTGSQIWNGGGIYLWEINAITGKAGTNWDLLDVNGTLTLNSTAQDRFTITIIGNLVGLNVAQSYEWTILTASGGFDGIFDPDKIAFDLTRFTGIPEGMEFRAQFQDNALFVKLFAIPEPSAVFLSLTMLGVALLCLRGRGNPACHRRL